MTDISSRAEYRHEDYFFQRVQSRGLAALQWERSGAPLKSYGNYIAAAVAASLLALLAFRWW